MNRLLVLVDLTDGVLRLTLNRPDKLNSFNEAMHLALRAGFERAHAQPQVRAVLLTGAGRGFCAGQDLGDRDPRRSQAAPDLGQTLERFYNPLLRLIRGLEKPVICAVNGVAAGAGANIALACDIVLAASFGTVHPGVCQDRAGAGCRRQLVIAASDWRGARQGAGARRLNLSRPKPPQAGA